MELEMAHHVTNRSIRFVTLPFIIAAVEVRDEDLRPKTLQRVDYCVDQYAPFLKKATKTFLSRVWREPATATLNPIYDRVKYSCRL
jgi:hypothetical protein